jgi:hypothetical protein
MFKWNKLGQVFKPKGNFWWMNSHITPLAVIEIKNSIRVFICSRSQIDINKNFVSYTSFIDVDKNDPTKILYIHDKPIIDLGCYGAFDEFGVMVTNVEKHDNKIYLYYAGWQRLGGGTASYQVMLGLAISNDEGNTFNKYSIGPILGIDDIDPFTIGNVAVLKDDNNWKLYYTSITKWILGGNKPTYEYNIKYATSQDGIHWKKENIIAVEKKRDGGVATPTIIKLNNQYHMWFGYRSAYENDIVGGYKIGYANSSDGVNWVRNDSKSGIQASELGWDSTMVCYPDVIKVAGKIYLFYCGNNFGEDGFGVAELN